MNFFTTPSAAKARPRAKKEISPQTALKGTPYHGLNVSTKNRYDDLSAAEIQHQLQQCQDLLGRHQIVRDLPDNGTRIKRKIELLDEALIRVQARSIIREKNEKQKPPPDALRQRLNFGGNPSGSNANESTSKVQAVINKTPSIHRRMLGIQRPSNIPRGLAKNLGENNLKDLLNSIQTLSIDVAPEFNVPNLKATLYPHQIAGYQWMIKRETHDFEGQPYGGIIADEMGLGSESVLNSMVPFQCTFHGLNHCAFCPFRDDADDRFDAA